MLRHYYVKNMDIIEKRLQKVAEIIKGCALCPRKCKVDRTKGVLGWCEAPLEASVYSYQAHFGEEPPISGEKGSGAVFFSYCTMRCAYCQNYAFSQLKQGRRVRNMELADIFLKLQATGCHNLNLVTPTHFLHPIIDALSMAREKGFKLPVVYNT